MKCIFNFLTVLKNKLDFYATVRAHLKVVNVKNYLIHTANISVCIELIVILTDITEFVG